MIKSINEHQPHIVVNFGDKAHVLPVSLLRQIANGEHLADNELVRVIARALISELGL